MSETRIDNLVIEISADSSAASNNIDKVTQSLKGLNKQTGKAEKTASALRSLSTSIKSFSVTQMLQKAVSSINNYVENINLYRLAMGDFADAGLAYAEKIQDVFGIDASEFIRNQAIFKNMATGFGMTEEKAYQLSKGLTELAYDLSSLTDTGIDETFQRLQSAIAGEIEPVRRWGIALSQASMKQWMLKKGIDANVNSLTEADKALVRYNMLVETVASQGGIGNLARELETPANAIRILNQRVNQMYRAIGTLLIPILIKVIPYIQAFVKVITNAAQAIANFLGIKIDFNVDYDSVQRGVGGVGNALDDAAKSAKKLKDYTMGFDELNIINPDTGSDAGQQAGMSLPNLDVASVWDEALLEGFNNRVDELAGKMEWLVGLVTAVGVAFAGWKISSWIASELEAISDALTAIAGVKGVSNVLSFFGTHKLGIALAALAIAAVALALVDLWENSETFRSTVTGVLDEIKAAFGRLKDAVWDNMVNPILEAFGITADSFSGLYEEHIRPIVEKAATILIEVLGGAITATLDFFSGMAEIVGGALENVLTFIKNFVTAGVENVTSMRDQFKALWGQVKRNTIEKVTALKDGLKELWGTMMSEVTDFKNQFTDMFEQIRSNVTQKVQSMIDFFGDLISKIRDAISTVKSFFKTDTSGTVELNSGRVVGAKVEKYATGGFLEDGLFTMNHGEIAGKFSNGKSVVANNQQIIDGIADGVYRAMIMAQNEESSKPMQVNVYLDGKQVSKSVNKYNSSRGVSIMGNSLGYNF